MPKLTHEEALEMVLADDRRERRLLRSGLCPECEEPGVHIDEDAHQGGFVHAELKGTWHNIRCDGCGYISDRLVEPGEYLPN